MVGHLVRSESMLIYLFWHGLKGDSAKGGANNVNYDKCEEWQKPVLKCEGMKDWKK